MFSPSQYNYQSEDNVLRGTKITIKNIQKLKKKFIKFVHRGHNTNSYNIKPLTRLILVGLEGMVW